MLGEGRLSRLLLRDGASAAQIECAAGLVPSPGQYMLAHVPGSDAALATALFGAPAPTGGFLTASPIPSTWTPGTRLQLRGPLGHGFTPGANARRIVLVARDRQPHVLLALLDGAARQGASVALVAAHIPDDLPLHVEAQPPAALAEALRWADYAAFDVSRESLPGLRDDVRAMQASLNAEAQVLVRTAMPCGALAACGVCSVEVGNERLLACADGPVFDLRQLMGWASRA